MSLVEGELPVDQPAARPRTNLHDQVIADLRSMVMCGELAEGQRVPEAMLCEKLKISRTPLREALKVLAAEGFIELRPNRGAVVAAVDGAAVAGLFEVKGAIERLIGQVLPARITAGEMADLEGMLQAMRDLVRDNDRSAYTVANQAFHAALAAATKNEALVQIYAGLQQKILRARFAINERPAQIALSVQDHEVIMAMLRAGAALDLAHCLEEHSRRTGAAIIAQLPPAVGAGAE